jgi:hypothetical protein
MAAWIPVTAPSGHNPTANLFHPTETTSLSTITAPPVSRPWRPGPNLSPQDGRAVSGDGRVAADYHQAVGQSLGDQHPVKRVAVQDRQAFQGSQMGQADRQQAKTFRGQCRFEVLRKLQFSERPLDDDFP